VSVQVIPCCADTALFKIPRKRKVKVLGYSGQHLDDYGWQGKAKPESGTSDGPQSPPYPDASGAPIYTLSYLGSIGTWYLLDEMLRFFARLLLQQPDARFLFITPDDPQVIRQRADALGISGKKIDIRQAERKEVPLLLAQSQFSLFFIKPSFSKKASSPTKMGEVLAMGLPVICNSGVGDTDYIVRNYQAGAVTDALTDEAFDRVIARMDDLLQLPPEHYRKAALDYFDLQKGVELYDQVYRSVL
jgi:glycosyltransferase involved in cell wall biosynthesis